MRKKKYFFDMDGTLADFYADPDYLERMYDRGYYANLSPHQRMIDYLKNKMEVYGKKQVFILSACVDTEYCADEKLQWLKTYIPEMLPENIILMQAGQNKANFVPGGIDRHCILIDDYSVNLNEWIAAGGTAIKAINGINNKSQRWNETNALACEY